MKISIGFPPGPRAREMALLAEELGYDRVWLYDSAALYEDIWAHLALIADSTERIGLGTAVLVPNLRHVMTTASAIATIDRLAPGRLACAIGTGFTARLVLDQQALPWKQVKTYVEQLQGLLRGDVVRIDGKACQMLHHPEMTDPRPIEVPILLSAFGPKGTAITREIADGWMGIAPVGKRITMRSLDFWRLERGLIREHWVLVDLLDVYDQVGVDVFRRMREVTAHRQTKPINPEG